LVKHQFTGSATVTPKPFDVDVRAQFMTIDHKSYVFP
jgi:hypothetical protein